MEIDVSSFRLDRVVPVAAANDQTDIERVLAVVLEQQRYLEDQQRGIEALTGILIEQKADIAILKQEVSRLKARTDAPPRKSNILRI